jgi:M6 family metalloprotease-like protein
MKRKARRIPRARQSRTPTPWFLLSMTLVMLMVLASFGFAFAADDPPPPPAERTAEDPYDQWQGDFLDFVPPNPDPIELIQPDGTAFQAQLTPMETGGQVETPDGYTVVQDAEGWWTFAETADAEGRPVPGSLKAGKDSPQGLAKKVGQHDSIWLDEQGNDKRDAVFAAVKDVQSPNASIFTADDATVKNYHYVVILAEFQDVKFESYQTPQYFKDQISGLGHSPTGSVTDLYYEMSYGQFLPDFEVIGPFTLPGDMYDYDYQLPGGKSVTGMISDLSDQLKALGADFWDQFDNDRVVSGGSNPYRTVDMTVVLHAGPGKEATGQPGQVWSHASNASTRNSAYDMGAASSDGIPVRIRGANTVPAIGFNIGVVAHEMGHTIGESDYYDTQYRSMGSGDWDLMAGGSWMGNDPAGSNPSVMNPYSRINQGWVTPEVVDATTLGVELRPRTMAPDVIEIPLGGTANSGTVNTIEKLYVEMVSNRIAGAIFDKAEYATGLLIWHYDRGGSNNKPSNGPARYRMGVQEYDFRDGTQELQLNLNRGEPTDPWSDTALGMTPYTSPNTNRNTPLEAGGPTGTGWYLMNISGVGDTMSLDIVQEADVQGQVGVDRPQLLNQPVIAGTGPATFSTKVYNLTAEDLSNVQVEFWATMGSEQVKLAETTLTSLPAGAPTAATATWAEPMAGKWNIEAVASVDGGTARAPGMARVFARSAPVLIVDDDDGYTSEEAFEGALTSLGVPYVLVEHTAQLALLQGYELVIWSAGQAGRYQGQLDLQEVADLKAYLDAGGKLWMSSPRLANALGAGTTGASSGVDPAFLRDYFGTDYPMSSQAGGGVITGLGELIGGTASIQLRQFPGRAIEDYLDQADSTIGSVTPLFDWSFGHNLGMEVLGDEAHNNFHVVYFGFNLSQVISGADRLTLTQQVLDSMGMASVYFDKSTYLMQKSGAVKVTVHDWDAVAPQVLVSSDAQPAGVVLTLVPTDIPGTFTGVLNVQKTSSKGGALKVNDTDTLKVVYEDASGPTIWSTAGVLLKTDEDQPATIYHDLLYIATDAQDLPVMAVVTDDIRVQKVELYYRVAGSASYVLLPMEETFHNAYTAVIPAAAVTPLGAEYYIRARDSKGTWTSVASADEPSFIVVQPRTLGAP